MEVIINGGAIKIKRFAKFFVAIKLFTVAIFSCLLFLACNYTIVSNDVKNLSKSIEVSPTVVNTTEGNNTKKIGDALLEKNRQLWSDKKISNYDFVASLVTGGFSYPAEPVRISVRNQKVVSIERLKKDDLRDLFYYDQWATVEKLFDKIIDESQSGNDVTVKYNEKFGYPEDIGIIMPGTTAWLSFKVKSFEVVDFKN